MVQQYNISEFDREDPLSGVAGVIVKEVYVWGLLTLLYPNCIDQRMPT